MLFIIGIKNIQNLLNYANTYAENTKKDTDALKRQQGLLLEGKDVGGSLVSITNSALEDALSFRKSLNFTAAQETAIKQDRYLTPKTLSPTLSGSRELMSEIAARKENDPSWKGDVTSDVEREEQLINATIQQSTIMEKLTSKMDMFGEQFNKMQEYLLKLEEKAIEDNK